MAQTLPAAQAADHLLLGVADLDRGIAWVEERTGVRAAFGGSHPGRGTRNALVALGGRRYLEILAPDPAQAGASSALLELARDLGPDGEPRLVAWAAASADLDALVARAKAAGYGAEGPNPGERARPDGRLLRWRTADLTGAAADAGGAVVPFFIQWDAGTAHPSADSPGGCALEALRFEHPDPAAVARLLRAVGIDAEVARGRQPRLRATLSTPRGRLELT